MPVTLDGMVTFFNPCLFGRYCPSVVPFETPSALGIRFSVVIAEQLLNLLVVFESFVKLTGIVTVVRPLQPEKAS